METANLPINQTRAEIAFSVQALACRGKQDGASRSNYRGLPLADTLNVELPVEVEAAAGDRRQFHKVLMFGVP